MDQRVRFITEVNESQESFVALCERFGISRKTGYKWCKRYEKDGPGGLDDRAPKAGTCPHKTAEEVVVALVDLRKEHPSWGPKKLKARLSALGVSEVPAASTIGELLKKHGLVHPRRRRFYPPAMTPQALAEALAPNDTWCVDFKGHFALGDRTRCYPLTITDQVSRYLLKCEAMAKPDGEQVRQHFERVFREFGLPRRIRSDNGPPFASTGIGGLTALSVWWIRLGVTPERIEPGKPQQNGRHERMHRTLKGEGVGTPEANQASQQLSLDRFRHEYNDVRPHEALMQQTPASRYTPSRRGMPASLRSPEYSEGMAVRRVDVSGVVSWQGQSVRVSPLLRGEPVGIEAIGDARWRMHYGPVPLAELTMRGKELRLDKQR